MCVCDFNDGGVVKDFILLNVGKMMVSVMCVCIFLRIGASIDVFVVRCGFSSRAFIDCDFCMLIVLFGI